MQTRNTSGSWYDIEDITQEKDIRAVWGAWVFLYDNFIWVDNTWAYQDTIAIALESY